MEKGALLQCIEGYCCKELKAVDCNFEKSNQHEFNVNKEMKKLLGTNKKHFEASYWLYIGDSEQIKAQDTLSWYDARKSHPTRSEWRLYYGGNEVIEKAKEGDWLFLLKISEEYLILLILEKNSEALLGTKYLLGENSNSYVTENEHIYRVYNLINDTVLKTLESFLYTLNKPRD